MSNPRRLHRCNPDPMLSHSLSLSLSLSLSGPEAREKQLLDCSRETHQRRQHPRSYVLPEIVRDVKTWSEYFQWQRESDNKAKQHACTYPSPIQQICACCLHQMAPVPLCCESMLVLLTRASREPKGNDNSPSICELLSSNSSSRSSQKSTRVDRGIHNQTVTADHRESRISSAAISWHSSACSCAATVRSSQWLQSSTFGKVSRFMPKQDIRLQEAPNEKQGAVHGRSKRVLLH